MQKGCPMAMPNLSALGDAVFPPSSNKNKLRIPPARARVNIDVKIFTLMNTFYYHLSIILTPCSVASQRTKLRGGGGPIHAAAAGWLADPVTQTHRT